MSSAFLELTPESDLIQLVPGQLSQMADEVRGLEGDDTIAGSSDREIIQGNQGRDILNGGGGDDVLFGGRDNDLLDGGDGNDLLIGGLDDDQLEGGAGNDTLLGNMGGSILWGDRGADLFVLDPSLAVRDMGTADSTSNELPLINVAPYAYIKDFNASEGDAIALAGGLTISDLVLFRANAFSSNPAPRGQVIGEGGSDVLGGLPEIAQVTAIALASTGGILGVVRDVSPDSLRFISISDTDLTV
ncbi:calcium-binding protein [Pseudanabaena sp. PCC 6802]|uniref:calcium-binding protein n=1 Tax=Pseudanabaena sp. PCC 6802 TaxID=118173 RepID=UPI0003484BFA|nr:calcium-binding protein [Pseudanabaena sp. PCC 6802]